MLIHAASQRRVRCRFLAACTTYGPYAPHSLFQWPFNGQKWVQCFQNGDFGGCKHLLLTLILRRSTPYYFVGTITTR